jgi:hypothetical protein
MFITLQLENILPKGTLVCHDSNNIWRAANSADTSHYGVVIDSWAEEGLFWGRVCLAGTVEARAGAAIPIWGGGLSSDDEGRAVVKEDIACGIIAPLSKEQENFSIDDLVLVYIR